MNSLGIAVSILLLISFGMFMTARLTPDQKYLQAVERHRTLHQTAKNSRWMATSDTSWMCAVLTEAMLFRPEYVKFAPWNGDWSVPFKPKYTLSPGLREQTKEGFRETMRTLTLGVRALYLNQPKQSAKHKRYYAEFYTFWTECLNERGNDGTDLKRALAVVQKWDARGYRNGGALDKGPGSMHDEMKEEPLSELVWYILRDLYGKTYNPPP